MRIRELTLRNYRSFGVSTTFEFSNQFTVIAGINGKGKTAILDGLALTCSYLLPDIAPARSGYGRMRPSEVHWGADSAELSMKVICAGIPLDFSVTYTLSDRKHRATPLPNALKKEIRYAYGDPDREGDAAPLVISYSTDRAGYRLPKTLPAQVIPGQAAAYTGALFNRMVNFGDFMARYKVALALGDDGVKETGVFGTRMVRAVTTALGKFLGGFGNLRIQDEPPRLVMDKGGVPLDITQFSDGERSFLAIICDLSRRLALANPLLEDPLQGAGVVLIDELELHLHPRWQREVVDKLRVTFPNIQFITTTHSPFVIQSLRPGELINLNPDEFSNCNDDSDEYSDQSIEDITENVMGVELPQKSERYLRMVKAAEEYYRLLQDPVARHEDINTAEKRLDELAMPFSDDPAFEALLRLKRETSQFKHETKHTKPLHPERNRANLPNIHSLSGSARTKQNHYALQFGRVVAKALSKRANVGVVKEVETMALKMGLDKNKVSQLILRLMPRHIQGQYLRERKIHKRLQAKPRRGGQDETS